MINKYYINKSWEADESLVNSNANFAVEMLPGGIESLNYPGYPTGLIKSTSPISANNPNEVKHASGRYIYCTEILSDNTKKIQPKHLLYLNSYKKVETFNDYSDFQVETLVNYGFPAIYCSEVEPKTNTLSSCSEDVILDRLRSGNVYNRGIIFDIADKDAFFQIDRKSATLFRTQHLKSVLSSDRFESIRPDPNQVIGLSNEYKCLL